MATSETTSERLAPLGDTPNPLRTIALMGAYVALSSAVSIVTDLGLAWVFARVTERAERRAATPCGCVEDVEQLADVAELIEPYEDRVRIVIDTTAPANPYAEPIGAERLEPSADE